MPRMSVFVGNERSRTDEAHLPAQDVDDLGQLVEAEAAQQPFRP